ncbi:hypothetical protein [Halorubrum sp. BOL3-1]|uniref:hypothetical protein n=1 Tax=Halorubrum sp. BOL3-1 TaxID=2497325 RepID=UPI0019D4EF0B|nr:hypothetical protein [Halorubrum sp. BOL3-1]
MWSPTGDATTLLWLDGNRTATETIIGNISTLHPPIDRGRLDINDRFVGSAVVGDRQYRPGKFFGDRCLAILPAFA